MGRVLAVAFFGEAAMSSFLTSTDDEQTKRQHVCTRTVTALTDAHLSYFTPDAIKALCKKHPPLRVRLQRQVGLTMLQFSLQFCYNSPL